MRFAARRTAKTETHQRNFTKGPATISQGQDSRQRMTSRGQRGLGVAKTSRQISSWTSRLAAGAIGFLDARPKVVLQP